jgi:hypothetical protein
MGRHLLIPLASVVLVGCTHTFNIYLTGRASGITAQTEMLATAGHPSGDVAIVLKGKTYTGRWVYMSGTGTVGLSTATVSSGLHTATGTGMAVGLPSGGNGIVDATASDGSSLHCAYQYSAWSRSGVGMCKGSDGEIYDLQIS